MTFLKQTIAYTFLAIYVAAATIGLFGFVGVVTAEAGPLISVLSLVAVQTVALLMAIIKAPRYFEDPSAVVRLNEQIAASRAEVTKLNAHVVRLRLVSDDRERGYRSEIARLQTIIAARHIVQLSPPPHVKLM